MKPNHYRTVHLIYIHLTLGKYTNHKGKNRRFTNPEEIEEQMRREEKERKWRVRKHSTHSFGSASVLS